MLCVHYGGWGNCLSLVKISLGFLGRILNFPKFISTTEMAKYITENEFCLAFEIRIWFEKG